MEKRAAMTAKEQKKAAADFAAKWVGRATRKASARSSGALSFMMSSKSPIPIGRRSIPRFSARSSRCQ